ncbi:hypothetical protein J2S67_001883 [Pseudoglutamicibacter albus]|uniref:Uncharacterized protein n=2 Tax=Pseudoglutamicibacter albus TaxID=98671 RepID=A0ABU1Z3L0_9MICC|nr:hypothetical protein [Pseudoglutamicibacter albus]
MQATTKQKIFGINKQTWHTIEFSNNKHPTSSLQLSIVRSEGRTEYQPISW